MSSHYPYDHPLEDASSLHPPRRRQRGVQPPSLLTTSLNNAQHLGHGMGVSVQTPVSSTTLSSPFSVHQATPYPASPGGVMRGTSPMALRSAVSLSGQYNPQQWGPISHEGSPMQVTGSTFTLTHSRQASRVTSLAGQPRGPDGRCLLQRTRCGLTFKIQNLLPLLHLRIPLSGHTKLNSLGRVASRHHHPMSCRQMPTILQALHQSALQQLSPYILRSCNMDGGHLVALYRHAWENLLLLGRRQVFLHRLRQIAAYDRRLKIIPIVRHQQ